MLEGIQTNKRQQTSIDYAAEPPAATPRQGALLDTCHSTCSGKAAAVNAHMTASPATHIQCAGPGTRQSWAAGMLGAAPAAALIASQQRFLRAHGLRWLSRRPRFHQLPLATLATAIDAWPNRAGTHLWCKRTAQQHTKIASLPCTLTRGLHSCSWDDACENKFKAQGSPGTESEVHVHLGCPHTLHVLCAMASNNFTPTVPAAHHKHRIGRLSA